METVLLPNNDHTALISMYVMAPMIIMYVLSVVADLFTNGRQLALICINAEKSKSKANELKTERTRHSRIRRSASQCSENVYQRSAEFSFVDSDESVKKKQSSESTLDRNLVDNPSAKKTMNHIQAMLIW